MSNDQVKLNILTALAGRGLKVKGMPKYQENGVAGPGLYINIEGANGPQECFLANSHEEALQVAQSGATFKGYIGTINGDTTAPGKLATVGKVAGIFALPTVLGAAGRVARKKGHGTKAQVMEGAIALGSALTLFNSNNTTTQILSAMTLGTSMGSLAGDAAEATLDYFWDEEDQEQGQEDEDWRSEEFWSQDEDDALDQLDKQYPDASDQEDSAPDDVQELDEGDIEEIQEEQSVEQVAKVAQPASVA